MSVKIPIIEQKLYPVFDPTDQIPIARKEMQQVQLPVQRIDIFDRNRLEDCKTLFSNTLRNDQTITKPALSFLSMDVEKTLECYLVDKNLSSRLSIDYFEKAFIAMEEKVKEYNRPNVFRGGMQSFLIQILPTSRTDRPEYLFLFRVIERKLIEEGLKLNEELPPPIDPTDSIFPMWKSFAEDCRPEHLASSYEDIAKYAAKWHNERTIRSFTSLKEAFKKDLEVRKINPNAPLTHLVHLDSYEKEITDKRAGLALKIKICALGFFLSCGFYSPGKAALYYIYQNFANIKELCVVVLQGGINKLSFF